MKKDNLKIIVGSQTNFYFLYVGLLLVYLLGMFLPLMELDSAQHATMAMQMAKENNFWNIYRLGQPYLDKPHMHFWLAAISFKIFGISAISYRIPSILFLWAGAYALFRLGKLLYNKHTGHFSALIYLSAQTIILSAHDVRTDAVLTGATILAIWKIVEYLKKQQVLSAILGGVFLGIAFSSKGLLAVVVTGLSVFSYLLYSRDWNRFFNLKAVWFFISFLFSISPVLYAYYQQYDMHPELVVKGQNNISGVKFILWDQIFNRLNAKGFDNSNTDYFFFFHTLLWAFLPFALLAYVALYKRIFLFKKLKFKKMNKLEFLTLGGFLCTIILISFSKFKLPHYINSIIPLGALLAASYLNQVYEGKKQKEAHILLIVQYIVVSIMIVASVGLGFYVFGSPSLLVSAVSGIGFIWLILLLFLKIDKVQKIVIISVATAIWVNFNLNASFYPRLLEYQGGMQLAKEVEKRKIPLQQLFLIDDDYNWSFEFYTKQNMTHISIKELKKRNRTSWVCADEKMIHQLQKEGLSPKEIISVRHYHVTRLTPKFLNPKTRNTVVEKRYLLRY